MKIPERLPPPESDHFVEHRGWSLRRELTVLYNRAKINLAVGVTLSPLIIHLHAIILTNQVKTSWPYSLGIPSNAVNILYKNNSLFFVVEASKLSLRVFVLENKTPLQRQLIQTMFFFCLWPFKTSHLRSVCLFPFFLHPLCLVFVFFGEWGHLN